MDSGGPTFDFSNKEVYFSSCDTLVPFKNPSDAAIARFSIQKGATLATVQAVLDLIVFNPSFNSREVTLTSAGSIDEVVAEYREMQVLRRASVGTGSERTASRNDATSPLVISLIVSQIKQDMGPFYQAIETKWPIFESVLRTMSLVHRSWTMPAQELLFRRVFVTERNDHVRRLIQHPFCSRIRELHLEVGCMSNDDLDRFALLLRRLPFLPKLSLSNLNMDGGFTLAHRDDICDKIYSEIAHHLPILAELRIHHDGIARLEDCVKCILQGGSASGAAPFILKDFEISYGDENFVSEMLLSLAQLHPIVHHETPHYPYTCSSPQVPNSQDISKCSVTVGWGTEDRFLPILACLFGAGGVLEGFLPQISHFTFHLGDFDNDNSFTDATAFRSFFSRFLGKCTSLADMNFFTSGGYSNRGMLDVPFSSIPKSLQVLSIYYPYPVDDNAQERASGLERVVRTMHDRGAGSSLGRIEVTFCRHLRIVSTQSLQYESVELARPEYLDPVHRMCRELNIDLVCRFERWDS